jgi:hypothetical protein
MIVNARMGRRRILMAPICGIKAGLRRVGKA